MRGLVALLLLSVALTAGNAGGIKLRYGFQKGKVYKYKTSVTFFNDTSKVGKGASVKPSAEMSVGISLSVLSSSSMGNQRWRIVADTVGMRATSPEGESRVLTFEQLKGKSMELVIDDRGVLKGVQAVEPSVLNQTRGLGFEMFSRELFYIMLIFPQYPDSSIERNESWRFSWSDTVSRGGQHIVFTRETECKVIDTVSVGNKMCHKIAYAVTTRFRGQTANGATTATGMLYCTEQGIPIKSEASIEAVISAGGSLTFQKRSVKTILE